jgi:hypothetical protein
MIVVAVVGTGDSVERASRLVTSGYYEGGGSGKYGRRSTMAVQPGWRMV